MTISSLCCLTAPEIVHRDQLLRSAGVKPYCQTLHDGCLVWHRGRLIPAQSHATFQLSHGDYIRVVVPPFDRPEVPTHFAVRACQAGLGKDQIWQRYQDRGAADDDLFTDIEAAQPQPATAISDDTDALSLSQTGLLHFQRLAQWPADLDIEEPSDDLKIQDTCDEPPEDEGPEDLTSQSLPSKPLASTCRIFGGEYEPLPYERCIFGAPHDVEQARQHGALPSWTLAMHEAFVQEAAVEFEEEGPVGFIDTWYLCGHMPYVTEESRAFRVDQFVDYWLVEIADLWRDKIDRSVPLQLHWVTPTPKSLITRELFGHLILFQQRLP